MLDEREREREREGTCEGIRRIGGHDDFGIAEEEEEEEEEVINSLKP
jgi:hypothetical protein